ncbi:hypothetical protein Purlil1_7045 [Purpureocillium lilacinum]|uniref:Histidine acid phosphatase n=1 Tax=Purpureocillium lilacinum TaxID=33203 RepID=A0ABR0BWP5_PURLI|nr:hypothetical protein Purlil1_7045 [Purpureocillium lilacinum]
MAPLGTVAAVALAASALLLHPAAGQATGEGNTRVWAAVAYIYNGETSPGPQTILTPEGAQQLRRQGAAFRSRYLLGSNSSGTDSAQIQEIAKDAIDNRQLRILSRTESWIASGAVAFMQGLYPPQSDAYIDMTGSSDLKNNFPAGSNSTEYPLNGYQYPLVQTLSSEERTSVAIQGDVSCTAWLSETGSNLTQSQAIQGSIDRNRLFYQNLFSSGPLEGVIDPSVATYLNAYEIYELVSYQYEHNETVYNGLEDANNTLNILRANAFDLERAKTSVNTTSTDIALKTLYSIAGRTLAYNVANAFNGTVAANGASSKMTLMFGTLRPLLSFLSVGGLLTRENVASGPLSTLPDHGAAIVFELVSQRYASNSGGFPSADDLSVRFYYRSAAALNGTFTDYPLFGSGNDGPSIPFMSFVRQMHEKGTSPTGWCSICRPEGTAPWCGYIPNDSEDPKCPPSSSSGMSPAVGGVIGAVIVLGIIGLVSLALFALGGFRLRRSGKPERNATLGGFKGAERMPGDPDVTVTKVGAREERVGSWELRDDGGRGPPMTTAGIVTRDFHQASRRMEDSDGVSVNEPPVHARESV